LAKTTASGFSQLEQYVKGFEPDTVHQLTGISQESLDFPFSKRFFVS